MKKNQKIFTAMMFVCLICFFIGIIGIYGTQLVKADDSYSSFVINEGAQVRIAYYDGDLDYSGIGIRFNISISKSDYEAIKATDENAKFGILIAPSDYHTKNPLNKANVFGKDESGAAVTPVYGWAEKNEQGEWEKYEGDKTEIINLSTDEMFYDENDGVYKFYGSIVNILEKNKDREFVGVGYIQYSEGVIMADGLAKRSMSYIAQQALEASDVLDEEKTFLQEKYIDGVKSVATINHYKMKADGTYELMDTSKTDLTQIGTIVNAEPKTEYTGYTLMNAISNVTDTLLANGKTELNCYYYKDNLGLVDNTTLTSFDYKTAFPNAVSYSLKKVVWDNEEHENQTNYVGNVEVKDRTLEYKVDMTLNDYIVGDKLDLTKLDGVYEMQATYGSGKDNVVVSVKFDSYDATSTEFVWNNASTALDYARVYAWNGAAKDVGGQKETVHLDEPDYTGDYIKMDYIGTGTKTHPKIGGFSVLSLHSYEYYELALENDPTLKLSFNFKVKGVSVDGQTVVGLHGTSGNRNRVYVNSTETEFSKTTKHPAGQIQPETWYNTEIPLETLLKNWDEMRYKSNDSITNTNYGQNINKLIFWDTQGVDASGNEFDYANNLASFDVWVGDFCLKGLDFNNIASQASQYNFGLSSALVSHSNAVSGEGRNSALILGYTTFTSISAEFDGTEATINNKTNVKNFVFTLPASTVKRHVIMAVDLSFLTKDLLIKLKDAGYTKLTYDYVADAVSTYNNAITPCSINFDYLKENKDKNVANFANNYWWIDRRVFTDESVRGVYTYQWQTVEYSIQDLIDCYDQVFVGPYFILGLPWVNGFDGNYESAFYLSPIKIVK